MHKTEEGAGGDVFLDLHLIRNREHHFFSTPSTQGYSQAVLGISAGAVQCVAVVRRNVIGHGCPYSLSRLHCRGKWARHKHRRESGGTYVFYPQIALRWHAEDVGKQRARRAGGWNENHGICPWLWRPGISSARHLPGFRVRNVAESR